MARIYKCRRSECEFNCDGRYCELDEVTLDEDGCCEEYTHSIGNYSESNSD